MQRLAHSNGPTRPGFVLIQFFLSSLGVNLQNNFCCKLQEYNRTINIKFVIANEASSVYQYRKTKQEVINRNANIYLHQHCSKIDLILKYGNIKIPITPPTEKSTKNKAQKQCIKTKSNSVMADLMAFEFLFVSYSYRLTEAVIFREILL